jgi:CRISPR-associated endonuclease Csn1
MKVNSNKTKRYYLGLDVGIGSVGWAILGEENKVKRTPEGEWGSVGWAILGEENGGHWLEDFGVRLFSIPEDPKNKKSFAEKRRELRGKRRLLNRWHCRRKDLKKCFFAIFFDKQLEKDFENFTKKPTNLLENYDETIFFNPYVIRYRALNDKIDLVELLCVLLHLSKYRGYKEFYLDDKFEEKDEEAKKTQAAVGEAKKLFAKNNYRSVAEMMIKNEKFRHSQHKNLLSAHNHNPDKEYKNKEEIKKNHKHFIFPRKLLEEETQKILEKQSEYYPQLKKRIPYLLHESGKPETKEFTAQEVIKKIIFRQRDFEDGPTKRKPRSQEEKEIAHWKKYNRNITSKSFTEAAGYCQYFPDKKRGWRCSLIYCFFQFINEFSKIGGLEEKELGELEKVKEVHRKVFDWLISFPGYQPKTFNRGERENNEKRGTFRKQLEKFLDNLVGKGNYSFPKGTFSQEKGIKFRTEFLDYLKENNNFYSTLWKTYPSQFYLKYEDYQKTVFYQIGEIIFENITEKRRKKALDNLTKKYSLEPFQGCLTRLEKYDGKRSPTAVSFPYMVETIKAFLEGKKYGEFQAEKKKELEKKLEDGKSGNENKRMWTPWMHPDLVRNPVVFRSFNQARKVLKNLFLNYPQGFVAINIETGRDLWNSEEERSKIERKNQDRAKEKEEIVQKLRDNNSDILINEENIKRYRLWEDQNEKLWLRGKRKKKPTIKETTNPGGICLYCSKEIDVWKLKDTQIDHIVPQSKWANDSFNNLTLTHSECNQIKGENLPFNFFQKYKTNKEWLSFKKKVDNLYKTRNPFKHKFLTLGEKEGWEGELEDFVSRNLNDTRTIATYLKKYVQNELGKKSEHQKTVVQSIKGSITSYFRKQLLQCKVGEKWEVSPFYYKDQLRSLTPYHHAIDAMVLAHFKSRSYVQLLEDLTKINQSKLKFKKQKINQEQLDSLGQEISKKWKRPEWELKKHDLFDESKNAVKTLENIIQRKEINVSNFFPIPNLKNVIEKRIPVKLEKLEKEPDWDQKENKEVKKIVIEVKSVLTESEYYEKVKGMKGNIHYPYISYVSDQKVKKETIASEQAGRSKRGIKMLSDICEKLALPRNISLSKLVAKIGLEKLNSEYGKEYNFMVTKKEENNYTIWDSSKYAGLGIKNDGGAERIKNIDLFRKKEKGVRNWLTENYKSLVRPYEVFTFNYSKDLESELVKLVGLPLIYTGTTGDRISSINIVGLVYDKKENLQNIYPEHGDKIIKVSNAINRQQKENKDESIRYSVNQLGTKEKTIKKISSSIKLLKIDILGKKMK